MAFKELVLVFFNLYLVSCVPWQSLNPSRSLKFESFSDDHFEPHWNDFKITHNKDYSDDDEDDRKAIFKQNLKKIQLHNYLHEKGLKSYTLGVNEYADMEHSEFVKAMNGFSRNKTSFRKATFMGPLSAVELPALVDWRKDGFVTEVKNQGHCGSCWAFSTTGALEGQHKRQTGKLVSLSEQNLVDCSAGWGNHGCNGGLMDNAFEYIKENGGVDTEDAYPYLGKEGNCLYKRKDVGADDVGFVDIEEGNEDDLKKASALVGPISIAIDASHMSFQLYQSGVYIEDECSPERLDHGVLAVGYGTDEDTGADYWIVKNSWGPTWGESGYIRMARNRKNQCGVATSASYPLV